jgi:hypothetical protein
VKIWRRLASYRPKVATGTAAFVALASSVVALGFSLWPSLKPDPGDEFSAHATVLAVERYVTVDEYLARSSVSPQNFAERRREWQGREGHSSTELSGFLAYVRVVLKGFKHGEVRLTWSFYSYKTKQRVHPDPAVKRPFEAPKTIVAAAAPSDETVVEQPLPSMPTGKSYFVRFELRTENGVLLDIADSKRFNGLVVRGVVIAPTPEPRLKRDGEGAQCPRPSAIVLCSFSRSRTPGSGSRTGVPW